MKGLRNHSGNVVDLLFLGDCDPSIKQVAAEPAKVLITQEAKKEIFDQMDYVVVNLECPLTNSSEKLPKSGPHLQADPNDVEVLTELGINVASLANNHILDRGKSGLLDTIANCERRKIKVVGAGKNIHEASKGLILKEKGVSIGLLSITENEFSVASQNQAGANPFDLINNTYQISTLKQAADFVFVIYHGGNEYYPLPSPRVKKTLRYFVDCGADAIISHHTHIVSGMEFYKGAPIFYGLGNFLFDSAKDRPAEWYSGVMVHLSVSNKGIEYHQVIPVFHSKGKTRIEILEGESKDRLLEEFKRLSAIIDDQEKLELEWQGFCRKSRKTYLSNFFGFGRVERLLYKRFSFWPFWKVSARRIKTIRNYIKCEAHQDVLVDALISKINNG